MKNQRILITGGTGFIGLHLLKYLREKGYHVDAVSEHGDRFHEIDAINLLDGAALDKYVFLTKPEIVYHLGAVVDLSRNHDTAKRCIYANILGTVNLLESVRKLKIERFFLTSTVEVYGSTPLPFREDGPIDPPSPYAVSKVSAEHLSRLYAQKYNFHTICYRVGTVYGPGQPRRRFAPSIIIHALNHEDISLATGKKRRDYIYISDVVNALGAGMNAGVVNAFTTVNIGGGTSILLIDFVEKIVRLCKSTSRILLGAISERILEADEWLMDISFAQKFLDWAPKTSLDDGLKRTVQYYRELIERNPHE